MTVSRNFKFGYPYHITSRGNRQAKIFIKTTDYKYFTRLIHKYTAIYEVPLFGYCLMPNHYHLLIQCTSDKNIPRLMHILNIAYAHYIKNKYKWTGHIFQGNYHSRRVGTADYFHTVVEYIKKNPVKADLSKNSEDYPWEYTDEKLIKKMTLAYEFMF